MGTQRIQRRHRNPGPFQGAQPRAGLIRKLVLELKAQSEGAEASEGILRRERGCSERGRPAEMVGSEGARSLQGGPRPRGRNVRRPRCVLGGARYHNMPSCQFDNFISQAHYRHILNAEVTGEESPGKSTCVG